MRLVHEPAGAERAMDVGKDIAIEAVGDENVGNEDAGDGDVGKADADDDADPRTLATTVETADAFLSRARGMMFRRSVPEDFALVFRFDRAATRRVHTLFVAMPLDVLWVEDGTVRRVERLRPWTGYGAERADVLVELPAGGAEGVEPGDGVRVESR